MHAAGLFTFFVPHRVCICIFRLAAGGFIAAFGCARGAPGSSSSTDGSTHRSKGKLVGL
jgi:hypothetical protein